MKTASPNLPAAAPIIPCWTVKKPNPKKKSPQPKLSSLSAVKQFTRGS
jgi:hypothetical protein